MGNRNRGETTFEANGKTYTLHFSTNALCELEDQLGMSVVALQDIEKDHRFGMKELRAIVWAGLRDRHPEIELREVGEIIDAAGPEKIAEAMMEGFKRSSATKSAAGEAGGTRPRGTSS